MLRKILAITGKPGLFKILSQGKGMLIVEELGSGKRLPVHARDKVVSLGDIAMYTESGDTALGEILDKTYAHFDGKKADIKAIIAGDGLRKKFEAIVEDFDRDRVHDNDIKKLFQWYNILVDNGFTKFAEEQAEAAAEEEEKNS